MLLHQAVDEQERNSAQRMRPSLPGKKQQIITIYKQSIYYRNIEIPSL